MTWEQHSTLIIMLTNVVEEGKVSLFTAALKLLQLPLNLYAHVKVCVLYVYMYLQYTHTHEPTTIGMR